MGDEGDSIAQLQPVTTHIVVLLEVGGKNLGICSAEIDFGIPALQILNQGALIYLNRELLSNPDGHSGAFTF